MLVHLVIIWVGTIQECERTASGLDDPWVSGLCEEFFPPYCDICVVFGCVCVNHSICVLTREPTNE